MQKKNTLTPTGLRQDSKMIMILFRGKCIKNGGSIEMNLLNLLRFLGII